MIPGRPRILFTNSSGPLVIRQKLHPRRLLEEGKHPLRISAQGQSCRRNNMKALADRGLTMQDRLDESLRNIVRVNMMHRLHPKVRQRNLLTPRDSREDPWVEVPLRIDRVPSRPNQVTRMQHRRRKAMIARLAQQIALNLRLPNPILTKGTRCADSAVGTSTL